MYRELDQDQIKKFANRYLKGFNEQIKTISCITYHFVKEYLVNSHYFAIVRPFKVEYKDIYKLNQLV